MELIEKKSYGFEFRNSSGDDLPWPILGLPAAADWVLVSNWYDDTLLRNHLAYDLGRRMMDYAPRTRFVEIFVNETNQRTGPGHYAGLYLLVEKIEPGPNRINIVAPGVSYTDVVEPDLSDADVTGGYILKVDKLDEDEAFFRPAISAGIAIARGAHRIKVAFHYPEKTFLSPDPEEYAESILDKYLNDVQFKWVVNFFNAFEDALFGPDFDDRDVGYRRYIDLESFVDFFLINEVMKNIDAYGSSTFMRKDRNPAKLMMGPLWDFDLSGNYPRHGASLPGGWILGSLPVDRDGQPPWWARLLESVVFRAAVVDRWNALRHETLNPDRLDTFIDATVVAMAGADARNFERWDILGTTPNPDLVIPFAPTYAEAIAGWKLFLRDRIAWMDETINSRPFLPGRSLFPGLPGRPIP